MRSDSSGTGFQVSGVSKPQILKPYMKLHQNDTVSYLDQTGCFLTGGPARVKLLLFKAERRTFSVSYWIKLAASEAIGWAGA